MMPARHTIGKTKRQARGGKFRPSKRNWYKKVGWFQGAAVTFQFAHQLWENRLDHGMQDPPPEPTP
eukprot:12300409-Prorocentrum_lima.AAC.1